MELKANGFILLILFSLSAQNILSQDFTFRWTMDVGEFGDRYEVKVNRIKSKSIIEIAEYYPERSIKKNLTRSYVIVYMIFA